MDAPHVEDSEDEKEIDRADQFESKYNFRFEEVRTPSYRLLTFVRHVRSQNL